MSRESLSKMDGLIPMVYRAIKKHKTRSNYQCLSAGNINIIETYPLVQGNNGYYYEEPSRQNGRAENFGHHRRYNSVGDFYDGGLAYAAGGPANSKQLVRFRSHKFLSCVTGCVN